MLIFQLSQIVKGKIVKLIYARVFEWLIICYFCLNIPPFFEKMTTTTVLPSKFFKTQYQKYFRHFSFEIMHWYKQMVDQGFISILISVDKSFFRSAFLILNKSIVLETLDTF